MAALRKLMILCIVFSLLGIAACKKYGDGYVKGTVTKYGSELPFPGGVVYLVKSKKRQKDGNILQRAVIDSAVTDAGGEYHIPYHKATGYNYSIYVNAIINNMYGQLQALKMADLYKKIETRNLQVDAVAYLKIHQKKISTIPYYLVLNFGPYGGYFSLPERNSPIDTILAPIKIVANLRIDFNWIARNKDPKVPSIEHTEPIYLHENDTLVYEIKY